MAVITAIVTRSKQLSEKAAAEDMRRLGRLEVLTEALRDAANTIEQANEARQLFRDRYLSEPDSLRDDDGYRRDDIEPKARDPTA
jgi:ubiquinone biosynthesis protein Coq4